MVDEHNYNSYNVDKKLIKEKVSTDELSVGMYVVELDRPWIDTPFLFQGFLISSEEEIDQLVNYCDFVFIEVTKTKVTYREKRKNRTEIRNRRIYKVPVEQELGAAISHYDRAKKSVDNALTALRFSQDIDVQEIQTAVKSCVHSILNNPNAMLWLSQIKDKDDYTAEHSLRVSIMSVALGRELGLLEKELEDIGMAGMLHDVGKIHIPIEILNKEGELNKDEYEIIKTHTTHGRRLLMSKSDVPAITVDVAYNHHEHLDGNGYPRGITGEKIPFFAKIVAVVDAFDAITSDRVYSHGRSTLEAMRILYDCRGLQFDEEVVRAMIRLIGIYPPGHIAELTSGEVGIILSCQRNNKLRPKILIVRDVDKQQCRKRIVDLSKDLQDDLGKPLRVKNIYANGKFGINLQDYKAK
ncbi:MAG: HD-GYP domain-containing protein (c-di-GMP phosphodiesterase class II) [Oceanicoccus sp.]|jgi:HD-GYP domain-containing protein (c-di-GMP phosphodiesterase class II)